MRKHKVVRETCCIPYSQSSSFFFPFSLLHSLSSSLLSLLHNLLEKKKEKKKNKKRKEKKKKSHSRSSNGGMRPFWGRDLPTCSPYHHRGTAMEYCYTPRRIRNEIFYRKDGREVGANYGLDSSA